MICMTDHLLVDGPYFAWHHADMEQNDITSPSVRQQRWKQMGGTQEKRETFVSMTCSSLSKLSS